MSSQLILAHPARKHQHQCLHPSANAGADMALLSALPVQSKQFFPRDGSKATPPHPSTDFRWKDYCPMAFRQLREVFNIEAAEYVKSICGAQAHPHRILLWICLSSLCILVDKRTLTAGEGGHEIQQERETGQ